MRVTLVISGDLQGKREIGFMDPGEYVIGRTDEADVTLHDPRVSKSHCMLVVTPSEVRIRDHGSTNGTRADGVLLGSEEVHEQPENRGDTVEALTGRKLVMEAEVHNGSVVEIGSTWITIMIGEDTESEKLQDLVAMGTRKLYEGVEILNKVIELDPRNTKANQLMDLANKLQKYFRDHPDFK